MKKRKIQAEGTLVERFHDLHVSSVTPFENAPVDTEEGTTMAFPKFVPLQYPYKGNRFYVRTCYREYYQHIKNRFLSGKTGVTISGTPGK